MPYGHEFRGTLPILTALAGLLLRSNPVVVVGDTFAWLHKDGLATAPKNPKQLNSAEMIRLVIKCRNQNQRTG